MTDARFPERWLNDRRIMRLPAHTFRAYILTLAWSVANRTDGYLSDDDVDQLGAVLPARAPEDLAVAWLWERTSGGWLIIDYENTQTTSDQLAAIDEARRKARDKKRRQRARLSSPAVPRDVPRDNTRTGQARTGSLLNEVQGLTPATKLRLVDTADSPFPSPQTGDGSNNGASRAQHFRIDASAGAKVTTVTRARTGRPPIPDEAIREIRELRSQGHSMGEIAKRTGRSKGLISKYVNLAKS